MEPCSAADSAICTLTTYIERSDPYLEAENSDCEPQRRRGVFATTHWSVVLAASDLTSPQAGEALEQLCRLYWYPLYVYVRRRGYGPEDAQDLTQGFFAHLLRQNFPTGVGPEKGRFRSFLLACLKHFLTDEWHKGRTAKRGGAGPPILMDWQAAEERYGLELPVEASAERLYERRWAMDLLDHVLGQLREEATNAGKEAVFEQLQSCLFGERRNETYAELAVGLNLSESAVKVTVHRMRQRCRELLREQIAHTVSRPGEIEQELHYLFGIVSR